MSEPPPPGYDRLTFRDFWEILRVPALFALAAIVLTWLVWYLTSASCPAEISQTTGCNPSRIAQYINLDALNKMMTHAVIGGGGGGIWSYAMITRERKARESAEKAREVAEKAREAAEKAREAAEKQLTEEREIAAEERRQLLAVIERLSEGRNGGGVAAAQ